MDKGVPTDYHSMIGLVMRLREVNNQNHRVLVHCRLNIFDKIVFFFNNEYSSNISSAGIGRSGVFIALYYLLEAFELHQMFNVKQVVDTMRLYRPHLVQTIVYTSYTRCLQI